MKKTLLMLVMMLTALFASAEDIKTVVLTTTPQMHCENFENKIKTYLKVQKGVKQVETNVGKHTVTVKYDAEKTSADNIKAAFSKFGFTPSCAEAAAGQYCKAPQKDCAKMKVCGKKKCDGNPQAKAKCVNKANCNGAKQACNGSCDAAKSLCNGQKGHCGAASMSKECCKKQQKANCCKE